MTVTSNNYNFGNAFTIDSIIDNAFLVCGKSPSLITGDDLKTSKNFLNLIFSNWVNLSLNLWAIDQQMITLIPGQNTYNLPVGTIDVVSNNEASVLSTIRQITSTGVAASSSGNAANAFDNNLSTSCTQLLPNGWISYDLGENNDVSIPYIGINSNVNRTYKIAVQYSNDNINWETYNIPQSLDYKKNQTSWIVPYEQPKARYFRILETNNAILDITELYFEIPNNARVITRISRQTWISQANKTQESTVTGFIVQKQINPIIQFWPTPSSSSSYNRALYYRSRKIQDVNDFINNVDIPQRFYLALVYELAFHLSFIHAPERSEKFQAMAREYFYKSNSNDIENMPVTLTPITYYT